MSRLSLLVSLALCALLAAAPVSACPNIPKMGIAIDGLLKQTNLSDTKRRKIEDLQKQMKDLAAAGNEQAARQTEEDAMKALGFSKTWLKCGPGAFMWMKTEAAATTAPPAPAPAAKQ